MKGRKITLGTKEWADSNVNCYSGCSNDCRYCYAKIMAIRFKRKTEEKWKIMDPNEKNIKKGYGKRKGRIMFPTSHDITNDSYESCLIVLKKLVISNNDVLITTKPNYNIIKQICDKFIKFKENIQFRFTITSLSNELLEFWEPGAPSFEVRFRSLKYAFEKGFKTSVSIEPFLDENPIPLVMKLIPFITESIWIGKMNYIKSNQLNSEEEKFYRNIRKINTKQNLLIIIGNVKELNNSKIKFKDSITNYLSY